MIRGSITNTLNSTLWVHSDVLLEPKGRRFLIGAPIYKTKNMGWLWGVSYFAQPIVIYIGVKPKDLLNDYQHLVFTTFNECRDALRRDIRAIELVVADTALVCSDCTLFDPNLKRYF